MKCIEWTPLTYISLAAGVLYHASTASGQWILSLLSRIFAFGKPATELRQRFGEWALVTGGSDGIGEALAVELGRRGMNLWLVARSPERLSAAKNRILEEVKSANYSIKIDTFVFDFSTEGWSSTSWSSLLEAIAQRDIGLLVNNVGLSYLSAQMFDELPERLLDDLISVNLRSTFQMTRAVLPGMRERKRGAILCVGSGASVLPTEPLYAGYAAVKAAVASLCSSLRVECAKDGIVVQCHTPLLIATKLSKIRRASLTVLTPKKYARDAIRCFERDTANPLWTSAVFCPSFIHWLMLLLATRLLPLGIWNWHRLAATSEIRRRYMAKKA